MTGQPPVHATAQVKTERLLNLVIALLSTRMPLSKARIRAAVPQYHGTASDEAFDRMFERDKDELRELGIPLATMLIDPVFDDELGYRIDKREYALPEISFEPDEVAALSLAARTWTRASLAGAAASGLRKLRAAGVTMDEASLVGIEPVVRTTEEAFEPLRRAVRDRLAVIFGYRKPDAESGTRHLQPWGLAQWHGRWYLTGFDLDRGAPRVFRVGRIDTVVTSTGPAGAYDIPADHDPRKMVDSTQMPTSPPRVATLRVRPGSGNALRRRGRVLSETAGSGPDDEWSSVEVDFRDVDRLADEVTGYGPEVLAVEPTDLKEAVVRRLNGVAGVGEPAPEEEL
ncbi:MAG: WYL domain-containing protein [Lapillicoccus sp.]